MKKILPSILILIILVNMFAPFTVGLGKNNTPVIKKLVTEAAIMDVPVDYTSTSTTIDLTFKIHREVSDDHGVFYIVTNQKGTTLNPNKDFDCDTLGSCNLTGAVDHRVADTEITSASQVFKYPTGVTMVTSGRLTNSELTNAPETTGSDGNTYKDVNIKRVLSALTPNTTYYLSVWGFNGSVTPQGISSFLDTPIATTGTGQTNTTPTEVGQINTTGDPMPECGLTGTDGIIPGTITGCLAQAIYYVLFIPTSFLFALTGSFFDWTFHYSVSDDSYTTPFVQEGWGLVRDFCNIFFIFVLLYIAFSTILNIHGFKTKEMIINVVIIGLLINFSLFAAQVVIDTSNILARVFYNSDAIKITKGDANGVTEATIDPGPNGEIPLSAALVNKVNPQQLIINAGQINQIPDKGGKGNDANAIGAGSFILVTLLAIAVNVVGMIVFLSVGLIFIARVVGLWIYMIFAPLAFFSYTVPSMQGIDMVGWKKWWPELISMAFLAPIFIFFLYLILKFLETGFSLITAGAEDGLQFVISVMVPFAFIMILLWKAKGIAKKMSGELGQSITGAVATVGGLALGGAALGAAFAGRNIIGRGMAAASKTSGAQKMIKYRQDLKDYHSGKAPHPGAAPKLKWHEKIGDNLNKKQEKVNEIDHARHEMDSIKEKAGLKGVDDANLSGVDEQKMKTVYSKDKKSEAETTIRKEGYKDPHTGAKVLQSEDEFKTDKRKTEIAAAKTNRANINTQTGELKDEVKQKIDYDINVEYNKKLKDTTEKKTDYDFGHLRTESKQKVAGTDRLVARSNKGSYDARNLSQTKVANQAHWTGKMTAGLIAGIAMGVRTGLKGTGVKHGSGQSDLLKDLGHTITEAMESMKINVKVEESHGKSSDDHGGGGGGHH